MTFGIPDRGLHTWTLDDEKGRPIIKRALELGVNFFDTANVYSDGTSEEIPGPGAEGARKARRSRDRH
jgi:aryl-alcohol dehydrogenase-like predicted oxidoreductase